MTWDGSADRIDPVRPDCGEDRLVRLRAGRAGAEREALACRCRGSRSTRSPPDRDRQRPGAARRGSPRRGRGDPPRARPAPHRAAGRASRHRARRGGRAPTGGRSPARRRPRGPARSRDGVLGAYFGTYAGLDGPIKRSNASSRELASPIATSASARCGRPTESAPPDWASDVRPGDARPELALHERGDPLQPRHPVGADVVELGGKVGVVGVEQIAEQVHAALRRAPSRSRCRGPR